MSVIEQAWNAAIEFLTFDGQANKMGLHRLRVGENLFTRESLANFLKVTLITQPKALGVSDAEANANAELALSAASFVDATRMPNNEASSFGSSDAMEACIASLLGLPLEQVPAFYQTGASLNAYFKGIFSYLETKQIYTRIETPDVNSPPQCLHIGVGVFLDSGQNTAVLMRGDTIVHDPLKDKHTSEIKIWQRMLFIPMDYRSFALAQKVTIPKQNH